MRAWLMDFTYREVDSPVVEPPISKTCYELAYEMLEQSGMSIITPYALRHAQHRAVVRLARALGLTVRLSMEADTPENHKIMVARVARVLLERGAC